MGAETMKKLTLDEVMNRGLEIPRPNVVFELEEHEKHRHKLRNKSGVYMFKHNGEYIYIGIATNLYQRLYQHLSGQGGVKKLREKLVSGMSITIEIFIEENASYRDFYETYLIHKFLPECNTQKKPKRKSALTYSSKFQKEVVSLYLDESKKTKEIMDQMNISQGTMYSILKENGVSIGKRKGNISKDNYKTTKESRELAIELYKSGRISVDEIAQKIGVSRTYVYKLLNENGVAKNRKLSSEERMSKGREYFSKKTREQNADRDQMIVNLRVDENLTHYQIAEKMNIAQSAVAFVLKKAGHGIDKEEIKKRDETIVNLYIERILPNREIAKVAGVAEATIYEVLKKNNIVLNKRSNLNTCQSALF